MELDQDYGQNTFEFCENLGQSIASSKMFTICSVTELEGFCKTWPKSGTIRLGRSLTHNIQESRKEDVEFTFWECVMESPTIPIYSSVQSVLQLENRSSISPIVAERKLKKLKKVDLDSFLFNALTNTKSQQ